MKLRGATSACHATRHSPLAILAALLCCIPAHAAPPAITAIYPSGDKLPANHLKFYIHFTQPMLQGVFLQHCTLLDEAGKPVPEPFRETELWSEDRRRLTLWFHPGRQKIGVNLNVEFGPVLQPHHRYTLVISGKWPSEDGTALGADFKKPFTAIGRAAGQLDVSTWKISAPVSGTIGPLEIRFPAPLDHALLLRSLRVVDSNGTRIVGEVSTTLHEQGWQFTPAQPWKNETHRVLADPVLEDLAGNSLARPFEVDLQAPPPKRTPPVPDLPFRPTAKAQREQRSD